MGIKWPWVSRVALDEAERAHIYLLDSWNEAESRVGDANSAAKAIGEQLNEANSRLSRIIALETPNCAPSLKKAIKIARGEL